MSAFYPRLYQSALNLLIKARLNADLTPKALAGSFNQPEIFVSSYETGERLLDPAEFIALARVIGVDPYEILRKAEAQN